MKRRKLLGMLTPSSNTVLEPYTSALLAGLVPEVSAHFARLRVTEISLSDAALNQFDATPFVQAADLLADARCDVIAWSGTSGGWRGVAADRALCCAMTERTGIAATTSTLALLEALAKGGRSRVGLVTPYLDDVQSRIVETFAGQGIEVVAERHLNDKDNFSFAEVGEQQIVEMARAVAAARPQAIAIYCTNLRGAPLVPALERELGLPVYDSVSVTVWQSLALAGIDPARIEGWGSLFGGAPGAA